MKVRDVPRFVRTVRHLRPVQPAHRVRLRVQRAAIDLNPGLASRVLAVPVDRLVGWDPEVRVIDASLPWPGLEEVQDGRLALLGATEDLGFPFDWKPDVPQLWSFHLHYWDWAWGLVASAGRDEARRAYRELFHDWIARNPLAGRGDAWSAYVASLRAWSWCGQYPAMLAGAGVDEEFARQLALHAGYLRRNLELDIGGNHLIKNLKALVGLGLFIDDSRMWRSALRRLIKQLDIQVLPDGGHYERAPAYHCQVLADLVDLSRVLGADCPEALTNAVWRMRQWLGAVLLPAGEVPLLNDGYPVPAELVAALEPGPAAPEGVTLLADSGLAVIRRGPTHVIVDVGLPCPDDLPGHAHADTLGFLLHHRGAPVVGELGTSTYRLGPTRDRERGTAAHSSVEVDGVDSTEVWGAFRAGRRARVRDVEITDLAECSTVAATHDGYRHLEGRPQHRRTWQVSSGRVTVTDELTGTGTHTAKVWLHGPSLVDVLRSDAEFVEENVERAAGWEQTTPVVSLCHTAVAHLPWRVRYELELEQR